MSLGSAITAVGISLMLVYATTKILEFYGIGPDVYGSYVAFYVFLIISSFILPRYYYELKLSSKIKS
jgi:hypothetical protein